MSARRRRRLFGAAAMVAVTAAAVAAVGLISGEVAVRVTTAGAPRSGSESPATATTVASTTSTTEATAPTATTHVAPSTTTSTVRRDRPTTTSTAKRRPATTTSTTAVAAPTTATSMCRNSHDPACGPFRWDPQPVNDPMAVEVRVLTARPKVGQIVEFRLVATDDGRIERDCVGTSFGDDKEPFCAGSSASCVAGPGQYGPWTPPEKHLERFEKVFSHTYDKAGTYAVSFTVRPLTACGQPDPYANSGEASTEITIAS
jgi:hypothetical protein